MNIIRKHYGLRWRDSFPATPWRDIALAVGAILLLFAAWIVVDVMERADTGEQAARQAVHRADKADRLLVACLNNQPLVHDRTAIFCNAKEIQL